MLHYESAEFRLVFTLPTQHNSGECVWQVYSSGWFRWVHCKNCNTLIKKRANGIRIALQIEEGVEGCESLSVSEKFKSWIWGKEDEATKCKQNNWKSSSNILSEKRASVLCDDTSAPITSNFECSQLFVSWYIYLLYSTNIFLFRNSCFELGTHLKYAQRFSTRNLALTFYPNMKSRYYCTNHYWVSPLTDTLPVQ